MVGVGHRGWYPPISADSFKHLVGIKFIEIIHEDSTATNPLTIFLPPGRFRPALICYCQMQPHVLHMLPIFCGHNMAKRIGTIVHHHFWHAGRSRGKIQYRYITICCCFLPCRSWKIAGCIHKFPIEVNPSFTMTANNDLQRTCR